MTWMQFSYKHVKAKRFYDLLFHSWYFQTRIILTHWRGRSLVIIIRIGQQGVFCRQKHNEIRISSVSWYIQRRELWWNAPPVRYAKWFFLDVSVLCLSLDHTWKGVAVVSKPSLVLMAIIETQFRKMAMVKRGNLSSSQSFEMIEVGAC